MHGDDCWHHYSYTAPLGQRGQKSVLFVYRGKTKKNLKPVLEEMRIDNMTLTKASSWARTGLWEDAPSRESDRACPGALARFPLLIVGAHHQEAMARRLAARIAMDDARQRRIERGGGAGSGERFAL